MESGNKRRTIGGFIAIAVALIYLLAGHGGVRGPANSAWGEDKSAAEQDEYVITGRVTNAEGRSVTNATIEWGSNTVPFRFRQRAASDANGDYKLQLKTLAGRNRLAVSAPGYSSQENV